MNDRARNDAPWFDFVYDLYFSSLALQFCNFSRIYRQRLLRHTGTVVSGDTEKFSVMNRLKIIRSLHFATYTRNGSTYSTRIFINLTYEDDSRQKFYVFLWIFLFAIHHHIRLFDRPECLIKHFDNFAEQTKRSGVARPTVVDNFLKEEKKKGKETSLR